MSSLFAGSIVSAVTNNKVNYNTLLGCISVDMLKELVMTPSVTTWVVTATYITSPWYRVVSPIVIYIAFLRANKKYTEQDGCIMNIENKDNSDDNINNIYEVAVNVKDGLLGFKDKFKRQYIYYTQ